MMPKKTRRSLEEIESLVSQGDILAFYHSREWKDKRAEILRRDNYKCQRCLGKFTVEGKPIKYIKLTDAKYVHHIIPLKDNFSKALDNDNLISLCFRCHEVVEGRDEFYFKRKKKPLTEEKW